MVQVVDSNAFVFAVAVTEGWYLKKEREKMAGEQNKQDPTNGRLRSYRASSFGNDEHGT